MKKIAHGFFLSEKDIFLNFMFQLLEENCQENRDFLKSDEFFKKLFIKELICKGLASIKFISYAAQGKQLRSFTYG